MIILLGIQIGHLHPLLVHLPIGILVIAFMLELYGRLRSNTAMGEAVEFTLLIGAVSALLSLGTGWLLGAEDGYDEDLLFNHRWMAVAFTIGTVLLFFVKRIKKKWSRKLYVPLFVIVLVLIGLTGHFGGNITHGENYLFVDESAEVIITNVNEAEVYPEIIRPILDDKCISCHNPKKAKGGLVMSTPSDLLQGGDSGSPLDTLNGGNESLFFERVHLPLADDDHMPPKGKVQLTDAEKSLLNWWIKNQHCFDCRVKELPRDEKMAHLLTSLERDTSALSILSRKASPVSEQWLQEMQSAGISIHKLSKENELLVVSMAGRDNISKNELDALKAYGENIVELDLGFTNFNDDLGSYLHHYKNLLKLKLQHTQVTDAIGKDLADLELLESLNLYATNVTDALLPQLKRNKKLRNLYLWGTEVSTDGIAQLQQQHPNLTVQQLDEAVFASTVIDPPTILAESSFFKDSLVVRIESLFEDSNIYYTLDGSLPDRTSNKYKNDLVLKSTATIKAVVLKEDWEPSLIAESTFIKNNIDYEMVNLLSTPNEKYKGQKGKTLIDQKRGSVNFVDGNWLGFEGKHLKSIIQLKAQDTISKVSIGALSAPASWIFYPTAFVVSTSNDGVNFREIGRKNIGVESPNAEVKLTFFEMDLPRTVTKYVKLEIQSPLKNPDWHPNPGGKSWIFIDEIVLN